MKGQTIISFVISAVLFLFLIVYVVGSVMDSVNPVLLQSQEDEKKAIAVSVLGLLSTQAGAWEGGSNWESHKGETTRLGLASSYMILSETKISALKEMETETIQKLLGEDHNYAICVDGDCVRTTTIISQEEKFAEGTFVTNSGKRVKLKVVVQ